MKRPVTIVAFVCAAASVAPPIQGQPGSFTPVGNMVNGRYLNSTNTLLFDGRVLITGGFNERAELYDPATATFSPTGSLPARHYAQAAELLPNGKVLVVSYGAADLYDPATGLFSPTGSPQQCSGQTTPLPNGKVLFSGGSLDDFNDHCAVGIAEIYDPATGIFSRAGPYAGPSGPAFYDGIQGAPAQLLANGKVLIASEPYAQLYDPESNTFSLTGRMVGNPRLGDANARYKRATTLLPDGKVLLTGGVYIVAGWDFGPVADAEIYDPATGLFSSTQTMAFRRSGHQSVLMPDGTVFIAGGITNHQGRVTTDYTESFHPELRTLGTAGNMTVPRSASLVLLNDGSALLTGGELWLFEGKGNGGYSAELYRPSQLAKPLALLTVPANGQNIAAVQHADYELVSTSNPAAVGEQIIFYVTGLLEGVIPPQVFFGGHMAEVTYFGANPIFPGLGQINIRVPVDTRAGSALTVRVRYRGRISNEVTVPVR